MPIQNASDNQKVDYLWKKIVYGAAKTDIAGNIDATQEPIASPLQIRADKILTDSASIPTVIPGSNSSVVTVYPTTFPVECISTASIPTPTLTWQTGRTFWVPPEFGSTYQVKVYISPSGQAANVLTKGTQVFATGSGNNDLWVFDYQSGILNFNSNNTPYNASNQPISFTGNSVYISGAVYAGAFGIPSAANIGNTILGNLTVTNTTISTNASGANIYITPSGNGVVQFGGNLAVGIPSGTSADRPLNPQIGYTRFNTERDSIEYYDGTNWVIPGQATITSDIVYPDGVANTFPLTSNATTTGVMVSINGTTQQPYLAYDIINNNQIRFTEVPLTTDVIDVRHIAVGAVSVTYDTAVLYGFLEDFHGNIADITVTGNLLVLGNTTIVNTELVYQNEVISGNVTANNIIGLKTVSSSGNITASGYFLGNGSQLTGITATPTVTFETVSKNLSAYPYVINRSGTVVSNVVYTAPGGTITKAFTYSGGLIQSIAIYGTPIGAGVFTKNLTYVGSSVSGASYSVL